MGSEPQTAPIFTALAAVLAAIENGSIEEGEVESNQTAPDESTTVLTITVRRHVQPRFGTIPPADEK